MWVKIKGDSNMYRKALISTLFLLCCSCANKVDTPVDKPNKQGAKPSVICSTSSPVFDKSKIAQMLKNNGKITAAMKLIKLSVIT